MGKKSAYHFYPGIMTRVVVSLVSVYENVATISHQGLCAQLAFESVYAWGVIGGGHVVKCASTDQFG